MPRFVILRHEPPASGGKPLHWDLMLEEKGRLRTWALEREPRTGIEIPAMQLADHRLEYLDYEGPVSGNRGYVTRWDQGDYDVQIDEANRIVVQLRGNAFQGIASIVCDSADDQCWRVTFAVAEPRSNR